MWKWRMFSKAGGKNSYEWSQHFGLLLFLLAVGQSSGNFFEINESKIR